MIMKILIDTHIALWALMDDPKMPKEAEKILMDENNEIYYSTASRLLNPTICKERHVYFYAFNILEGMGDFGKIADSRGRLLEAVGKLGFAVCPFTFESAGNAEKWWLCHVHTERGDFEESVHEREEASCAQAGGSGSSG